MTGNHSTDPFDVGDALDRLSENNTVGDRDMSFVDAVQSAYPNKSLDGAINAAIESVWPAPSFREHQQETIHEVIDKLYVKNNDVVTLSAPTGAGKSLIIYATSRVVAEIARKQSFVTTPLNSLIDQIESDDFIENVTTIKGQNNYQCVHPRDRGRPVGDAICQREDDFECEYKNQFDTNGGCPYYGRKARAMNTDIAVTNLSYLMANSMIPETEDARFEPRSLLAIDETQNIEDFALNFINFTIDRRKIPINFKTVSDMPPAGCPMDEMVAWLKEVLNAVSIRLMELNKQSHLSTTENNDQDDLEKLKHRLANFLEDYDLGRHWTKTRDGDTIKFEPIFIGRFIDQFLWQQCDKVLLSSATIPKGNFLDSIGLDDHSIAHVEVESTFPTKNRPVITREMVGKMTHSERDSTIPDMAEKITEIADFHEGEHGFVHCHSYGIMQKLYAELPERMQKRTLRQDPDHRMKSLKNWYESDHQMFLSVSMDEGISLDDDRARWQVVAKASYPFMKDERVSYRLNELNDWEWYSNQAAIDLQQAVGRGMRSKDDWCVTYLLDSSFDNLLDMNENLFEQWFLDSVDCYTDLDVYGAPDTSFSFSA